MKSKVFILLKIEFDFILSLVLYSFDFSINSHLVGNNFYTDKGVSFFFTGTRTNSGFL